MRISRIHIYRTLAVALTSCLAWQLFAGFDISDIDKGYDSFRFVYHALGNCEGAYAAACEDKHVILLSMLGNSPFLFSFQYFVAACLSIYLITDRLVVRLFLPATPVIVYFLGQPGKDVFSMLGSLALFSFLASLHTDHFHSSRHVLSLSLTIKRLSCCSLIFLSIYLRPQSLIWHIIFCMLYFAAFFITRKRAYFFILSALAAALSISFAFLALRTLSSNAIFEATDFFGSEFAQSDFTGPLVGFTFSSYILRVAFNPVYILVYPIAVLFRHVQGFQYLLGFCLLAQAASIYWICRRIDAKNKLYLFAYNLLILSVIISVYPFPNIRYFIVFLPSLVCLFYFTSLRQGSLNSFPNQLRNTGHVPLRGVNHEARLP